MRVLHIITRMIVGGAQENTLFNCMDLLRDYSDEVTLVTGPSYGAEGELLSRFDTQGLRVITIDPLIRAIHPTQDAKAYALLKSLIREWQPQVVHTHSAKGGLLGRAAGWSLRVPCVLHTVHGAPFHDYQSRWSRWFFVQCERWAAKRCHRMICVADAMTELMVNAEVASREKFTTIYSGMDVEPFVNCHLLREETRQRLGINKDDIVIGKIARLYHLKGHEFVIEAAKEICRVNPNVRFLFVGDGVLRDRYVAEIERLGLRDRFIFTGLVPPNQVPACLAAMDVLVHASLREGLARALPQALIAGKPAISFDIDGAREVVLTNRTGFLIAPKDISGLVQSILTLASNASLRAEMGACGQAMFTEQFRHQVMTQKIRDQYLDILSKPVSIS